MTEDKVKEKVDSKEPRLGNYVRGEWVMGRIHKDEVKKVDELKFSDALPIAEREDVCYYIKKDKAYIVAETLANGTFMVSYYCGQVEYHIEPDSIGLGESKDDKHVKVLSFEIGNSSKSVIIQLVDDSTPEMMAMFAKKTKSDKAESKLKKVLAAMRGEKVVDDDDDDDSETTYEKSDYKAGQDAMFR